MRWLLGDLGILGVGGGQENRNIPTETLNWILLEADDLTREFMIRHLHGQQGQSKQIGEDKSRYAFVESLRPNRRFVGVGEFDGYSAYIFDDHGKSVLENAREGNAIYVFGANWKELSQLSKTKLMNSQIAYKRIVHKGDWQERLIEALGNSCL
jgi:hypothetical protein